MGENDEVCSFIENTTDALDASEDVMPVIILTSYSGLRKNSDTSSVIGFDGR